ncbi:type I secretion C-terminal target domain-containing protein [Nostoc sp. CCY 9925]|uniref:type I secretion C-terminal target domain-containing protein n=1 Tax=Nostoc sp. CCY 9925 TaxID=3103865 RepID=UPI0039C5C3FB
MLIKNNFGGFKKPEAFDVFVFSGADSFVYTNIKDAGDTIADFEVGTDKIVLGQLFQQYGLTLDFASAIASGYLSFKTQGTNAIVLIDQDGSSGGGHAIKYIQVNNVSVAALKNAINFAF